VTEPTLAGLWQTTLRWRRWLLGGMVVLFVIVFCLRRPLGDLLWPEARAQALREQAAHALAQGRLTAPDGSGARELYEAALAVDPDRNDARVGLMRVAEAALAQARVALRAERYPQAHRALQLARDLSVPRAQGDVVAAQLRQSEAAHAGIERWLVEAAAARAAHHLDGDPAAALPLYQRVLALQPDRVQALEGREDALSDLLQQARQALQRDDFARAAQIIRAARGYDAGHADLPDAEARLASAVEQKRARAAALLRAGHLQRATAQYRELLQIDGDDATARDGLDQVATAWTARATHLAADFQFAPAQAALEQARALNPASNAVHEAVRAIAHARQVQARSRIRLPRAERDRRVHELLQQAAAAQLRGDLLTPPGDSAFDRLRAARALSPDDAAIRRASARLLPAARECFERELRGNSLGRARACLDAQVVLEGESATTSRARRRLAQRWLAVGEERLRAGAIQAARQASASARAVDPGVPGLGDFEDRLATASANSR
jgi:tetratricopeptide (TPR) repeat protein